MSLYDEFVASGNRMFRWRSYLPLAVLPFVLLALLDYRFLGGSEALEHGWQALCMTIACLGLLIRVLVIGKTPGRTSGRNVKEQKADVLNTTGMYSLVRHPLYFGNFIIFVGILLFPHSIWLLTAGVLAFFLYYERIIFAEEEFLSKKFGPAFFEWSDRTPTFFPQLHGWKPTLVRFSWKKVLRREYSGFFAIIFSFTLLELVVDLCVAPSPHVDIGWMAVFSFGLLTYLSLRWAKKTRLISAE